MRVILCFLVLFCSGCVASQSYVEDTSQILSDLSSEMSLEFPNNQHIANISRKAQAHAEESGGFDLSWIAQILAMCGGGGTLGAIALGLAGTMSPGVKLGKKKKEA